MEWFTGPKIEKTEAANPPPAAISEALQQGTAPSQQEMDKGKSTKSITTEVATAVLPEEGIHPSWSHEDPLNLFYGLYALSFSSGFDFFLEANNLLDSDHPFEKVLPRGAEKIMAKIPAKTELFMDKPMTTKALKMKNMIILKEIDWTAELKGELRDVKWLASGKKVRLLQCCVQKA